MSKKKTVDELEEQIKRLQAKKREAVRAERKRILMASKKSIELRNAKVFEAMDDFLHKGRGLRDDQIVAMTKEELTGVIFGNPNASNAATSNGNGRDN